MKIISRNLLILAISLALCFSLVSVNNCYATTVKILSITNIYDSAYQGNSFKLPSTVIAKMSNKTTKKISVKWSSTSVNTNTLGLYKYSGTVKGYAKKVILYLKVISLYLTNIKYYDEYSNCNNGLAYICLNGWSGKPFKINGKSYSKGIGFVNHNYEEILYIRYKLNYSYKNLEFKLGMDDSEIGNGTTGGIIIYDENDNILYKTEKYVETQDNPITVNVNVSSCRILKIQVLDGNHLVIANPILTK